MDLAFRHASSSVSSCLWRSGAAGQGIRAGVRSPRRLAPRVHLAVPAADVGLRVQSSGTAEQGRPGCGSEFKGYQIRTSLPKDCACTAAMIMSVIALMPLKLLGDVFHRGLEAHDAS